MTSTEQDVTRAIVLVPAGRRLSAREREAMDARQWRIMEVVDPLLAFAELALRERAQSARTAWGLPRAEQIALVIVEPPEQDETAPLLEAVDRYFEPMQTWACASARLTALEHRGMARPSRRRLPPLAPTGNDNAHGEKTCEARHDEKEAELSTSAATISRDELDMLLEVGGERV